MSDNYGDIGPYGDGAIYGHGSTLEDYDYPAVGHENCLCGDFWRVEATDLLTGEVKAVLKPINLSWEDNLSIWGTGEISTSLQGPTMKGVWPHHTGLYVSQVLPDNSRRPYFGGYFEVPKGQSDQVLQIGMHSIDEYLMHRFLVNDNGGIAYKTAGYVSPEDPGTGRSQTLIAADLVNLARNKGVPLLPIAGPSIHARVRNWDAWELKNIGEAIKELTEVENGVKYRRRHVYDRGYWYTYMEFTDTVGIERPYTLRSNREGHTYGLVVDAKDQASRVYGVGAGEGAGQMISVAYDAEAIGPEFQAVVSWKDVSVPGTLDAHTVGYLTDHRDPVTVPSMSLIGLHHPKPTELETGDIINVDIRHHVLTFKGQARVISIAWSVPLDGPVRRVLSLQTIIRPSIAIRLQTPAKPVETIDPDGVTPTPIDPNAGTTPTPYPPAGKVCNISSSKLTEISGMQYATKIPGHIWTHDDENASPQVYLVRLADGAIAGSYTPSGTARVDPESMSIHPDGRLVLADIGDNDNDRANVRLFATQQPTSKGHKGTLPTSVYTVSYPFGPKNAECLMIHPITKEWFIVTKEANARVVSFGTAAAPASVGSLRATLTGLSNVTDGAFTPNGKFAFFRRNGFKNTYVYSTDTWKKVYELPSGALPDNFDGEAITFESSCSILIGSEGANSPVYRVNVPKAYGATCGSAATTTPTTPGTGGALPRYPHGIIPMNFWKLTLPTPLGSSDGVDEIKMTALSKYVNSKYFFTKSTPNGNAVVFRCPVNGGRTSPRTKYPRTELREMWKSGKYDESSWSGKSGTHTMEFEAAFIALPSNGNVVLGQIHGGGDDVTVLRLEGTNLWITNGDNPHGKKLTSNYVKGTKFKFKFIVKGGKVTYEYNGKPVTGYSLSIGTGNYFKIGCYVQDNSGSEVAETQVYSCKVVHS